jgi:AraC-like DNA-binding protein
VINPDASAADQDSPRTPALRAVIGEFGRHLDMLSEQLGASLREADGECASVGESFHDMAVARNSLDAIRCPEPAQSTVQHSCRQIGESLHAAVTALQYHDRLSQRLGLIRTGLSRLQALLTDSSPRSYEEWLHALREVEQINRAEQRRLGPDSTHEPEGAGAAPSNGSVELF